MLDKNKPQDIEEFAQQKFYGAADGIIVWCNPTAEPPTYWIDGGQRHTIPARAEQDATDRATQSKSSVAAYVLDEPSEKPQRQGRGYGRR